MGDIITVDFHGLQLLGFEDGRGIFVAVKPLAEGMGLAWNKQLERIERDPVLSEGMTMMGIPFARGGEQEAVCLPLDLIPGFLFRVDASRIKDEGTRARVLMFQREAYGVLARAFIRPAPLPGLPPASDTMAEAEGLTIAERRKLVVEARQTHGAVFARRLWRALRLPWVNVSEDGLPLFTYTAGDASGAHQGRGTPSQ